VEGGQLRTRKAVKWAGKRQPHVQGNKRRQVSRDDVMKQTTGLDSKGEKGRGGKPLTLDKRKKSRWWGNGKLRSNRLKGRNRTAKNKPREESREPAKGKINDVLNKKIQCSAGQEKLTMAEGVQKGKM